MKKLLEVSEDGHTVTFLHDNIVSVLRSELATYHPNEQKFIRAYQDRDFINPSVTNPAGAFKGMTQAQICKEVLPIFNLVGNLEDYLAHT